MGMQYLVADVGGTNTRVALTNEGVLQADSVHRYRNAAQSGIVEILQDYMRNHAPQARPSAVCIDVAGPVSKDQGHLTNLD